MCLVRQLNSHYQMGYVSPGSTAETSDRSERTKGNHTLRWDSGAGTALGMVVRN